MAFMMDDTHEIYNWNGVWRFADYGVATYYVATADGPFENRVPSASSADWRITAGVAPAPDLVYDCGGGGGAAAGLSGDLNGDCSVDVSDLLLLLAAFGSFTRNLCPCW